MPTATFRVPGNVPGVDTPQRTIRYEYDTVGRLERVIEDQQPADTTDALLSTTYHHDLAGNLDLTELPNGTLSDYIYDELHRLTQPHSTRGVFDGDRRERRQLPRFLGMDSHCSECRRQSPEGAVRHQFQHDEANG